MIKKRGASGVSMHASNGDNSRANLSNRDWLIYQERVAKEKFARWLLREMAEYASKNRRV